MNVTKFSFCVSIVVFLLLATFDQTNCQASRRPPRDYGIAQPFHVTRGSTTKKPKYLSDRDLERDEERRKKKKKKSKRGYKRDWFAKGSNAKNL